MSMEEIKLVVKDKCVFYYTDLQLKRKMWSLWSIIMLTQGSKSVNINF